MLIDILQKYLPTAKIYLFGSRAKGYHDSGSDEKDLILWNP